MKCCWLGGSLVRSTEHARRANTSLRKNAGVTGRWHDSRHTLITELAESGAGDQTIMDIAGHVSKQMLKHYSHIRMEAKRSALESIVQKQVVVPESAHVTSPVGAVVQHSEGESLQKSLQWLHSRGHRGAGRAANPLKTMAPQVGLEPTTLRLTAGCSAIELLRSVVQHYKYIIRFGV